MKFLLIYGTELSHPSVRKQKFEIHGPVYPPLGLLYIGRSLEDEGHHVEIIDFFVDPDPYKAIQQVLPSCDAVGLTVDNDSFHESAQLAQLIKHQDPSIPIAIGGPHCTLYPEQALHNLPMADVSVNGDGETAVKDIALAFQGKKSFADIHGVFYRENGVVKQGKPPELIEDLDGIPFPSRHLVKKYAYGKFGKAFFFKPPLTSMITTRGCPFRCRYCLRHIISYKSFRQRSAENVLQEFKAINEQGYGSVMIADDTFLANQKRAHTIMDGLLAMDSSVEILIGGTRVDVTDRSLYEKMKHAGVKYISFGVESGNQDVLDYYRKQVTTDQIKTAVTLSDEMGFLINGTFILGAPMETQDHFMNTINFACSLPFDTVAFYPLSYRHGSDLWNEAVEHGCFDRTVHEVIADKKYRLSQFSEDEILDYCALGNRKFYYRPHYFIHEFTKAIRTGDFRLLRTGLETFLHPIY